MIRSASTRSTLPTSYFIALWFAFITALGGVWAYYRVFTGFSNWDDEGSMMISVKQYLSGLKLYDQVWSGYGPIYYLYNWLLRSITATPVTHDIVRMSSLLPWLLTSLVCAWIVLRLTTSLVLASVAHFLTLYSLRFFANEPGHPQEICILLLVCLVASGELVELRWRLIGEILLGALPAALLLTKVNLGIFAILATGLALCVHARRNWLSRAAAACFFAASMFLPFALMKHQLGDPAARVYCIVEIASVAALGLALLGASRSTSLTFKNCRIVAISFVLTFAAIVLTLLAQGSSLEGMLYSLLLLHLKVSGMGLWYIPAHLSPIWLPWAFSGMSVAGWFTFSMKSGMTQRTEVLVPIKLIFGLGVFASLLSDNGSHLFLFAAPFCWLLLYPRSEDGPSSLPFLRTLLCTTAVIQTLYAYPVAGSQILFIQTLLIVVAAVCISDFVSWFNTKYAEGVWGDGLLRFSAAFFLILVTIGYVHMSYSQYKQYESLSALNLAGAERIHLPKQQARDYQWLTQSAIDYCDVLVGLPNLLSLNLWATVEPPARMNSDAWILVLTDREQMEIVSELSTRPRACAIYNPDVLIIWNRNHLDLSRLPLVRYIRDNFRPIGSMDNYFFLVRNERDLTNISERRP
jgi:hypothetical protein